MAESTADVRRDIELTRERMTSTLNELERKLHVTQIIRDNPWPAIGVAFGAGLLLSGSRADVKAAAATATATRGATSRLAPALDDIVGNLMQGLGLALQGHVDTLLDQVKSAIGAPTGNNGGSQQRSQFADAGGSGSGAGSSASSSGYQAGGAGSGGSASAALGQRDEGLDGPLHSGANAGLGSATGGTNTWSPHTSDVSRSGGNTGGTAGYTPSSAGSQGMPRAD
jgi:hypothetical protein